MNRKNVLSILVSVLVVSGCATFPSWPDPPRNEPKPQYSKMERIESSPETVTLMLPDGQSVTASIGSRKIHEYSVNATLPERKQGLFGWLLSQWWVWLLVAFVVFVPGGWGLVSFGANRVRGRMGQVVKGVEEYLRTRATEKEREALLSHLRGASDNATKSEVSKIKRKI